MNDYIKSTDHLPKEATPVWVRICGCRPRKMYRIRDRFFYYNKDLFRNGNYSGFGDNVLWRYCENKTSKINKK